MKFKKKVEMTPFSDFHHLVELIELKGFFALGAQVFRCTEDPEATLTQREFLPKADPVYNWPYRPEMQFSLFDLKVKEVNKKDTGGNVITDADGNIINLIDLTNPEDLRLINDDKWLQILFDIYGPDLDPLERLGEDRQLAFVLGGVVKEFTLDANGNIVGGNSSFDTAELTNLTAEDFLMLQLLQLDDRANVLWEFALAKSQIILHSVASTVGNDIFNNHLFYPNLGNKKVFINAIGSDGIPYGSNDNVEVVIGETGTPAGLVSPTTPVSFENGFAKFIFNSKSGGNTITPLTYSAGQIPVIFKITPENSVAYEIKTYIEVRNNSNTTLQDVLGSKGKSNGIFVYDGVGDTSGLNDHVGKTEIGGSPDKQYFDYVQYMMNMVTIPMIKDVRKEDQKYAFNPIGRYGSNTKLLLKALMSNGAETIPGFGGKEFTARQNISISYREGNSRIRTFSKLRRDYQNDLTVDNLLAELNNNPPELLESTALYTMITSEVLVGLKPNFSETRTIAVEGEFIASEDLGLYELFLTNDWDGDGLSNMVEVENAVTQTPVLYFDPLTLDDNVMTRVYARGYTGISGTSSDRNSVPPPVALKYGRGELAWFKENSGIAEVIDGFRVPDFGSGYYEYPSALNEKDKDCYTTPKVLRKIENIGRNWAARHPDTFPLRKNGELTGNTPTNGREGTMRFGINDISSRGGGETFYVGENEFPGWETNYTERRNTSPDRIIPYTDLNAHSGHENGLDVDVRYVRNDGNEKKTLISADEYDMDETLELIKLFIAEGGNVIYTTDNNLGIAIGDLNLPVTVGVIGGHRDHFHVRFPMEAPMAPVGAFTKSTTVNQEVNFELGVIDTKGAPMPEQTVVYFREELAENSEVGTDMVDLSYTVYAARTDADGKVNVKITAKTVIGTAVIGIYRPSEIRDGIGAHSETEISPSERIGELLLEINQ